MLARNAAVLDDLRRRISGRLMLVRLTGDAPDGRGRHAASRSAGD